MSIDRERMLAILSSERVALGRTIQYTDPSMWDTMSRLPGWRLRDVVAHLASLDVAAAAIVGDEPATELEEYLKTIEEQGGMPTLDGFNDFAVKRRAGIPPRQLALEWGRAADLFIARISKVGDEDWSTRRVPWVAGDLPLRFVTQLRIAEWWAHGEDIRAGAGLPPRIEHWPMYAVNDIAIRMLPWALSQSGVVATGKSVRIELEGAGGGSWHYGLAPRDTPGEDRRPDAVIEGRGDTFAVVAARRMDPVRAIEDGSLVLGGDRALALTVLETIRAFG